MIENCFSFKRVPTLELDCHAIGDTSEKLIKRVCFKADWATTPLRVAW